MKNDSELSIDPADPAGNRDIQYLRSLFKESDRGFILLACERLDELLKDLHGQFIETHIADLPESPEFKNFKNKLTEWPGPIATFASRINLGLAYGLLSIVQFEDFQILKKIRNNAAHPNPGAATFGFRRADIQTQIAKLKHIESGDLPLTSEHKKKVADFRMALQQNKDTPTSDPMEDPIRLYLSTQIEGLAMSLLMKTISLFENRYKPRQ